MMILYVLVWFSVLVVVVRLMFSVLLVIGCMYFIVRNLLLVVIWVFVFFLISVM